MTTLPRLYKKTKTGATQICDIRYTDDTFIVEFGQLNGAMQSKSTTCFGTNIGRANERTPQAQAEFEALAKHKLKVKSGYSESETAPTTVKLPMKVKTYTGQEKNVVFPCLVNYKLNGVNATYRLVDGKLTLTSRGGEVYPDIPHIELGVQNMLSHLCTTSLAGELYIHGEHLQDITSYVKKPKAQSEFLEFHVFDIPEIDATYEQRSSLLATQVSSAHVKLIKTYECHSHEELDTLHDTAVAEGYEGLVIYNKSGMYEYNVRSSDVFKLKKALSAEFLITGYNIDKNNLPVFILQSAGGEFKAKPTGTHKFWANFNPDDYIGNYATCEYETASKIGKPLKPVFISLRDVDPITLEPKE